MGLSALRGKNESPVMMIRMENRGGENSSKYRLFARLGLGSLCILSKLIISLILKRRHVEPKGFKKLPMSFEQNANPVFET